MQTEKEFISVTTKTGDDGYTNIIGRDRLPKNHPILESLGTLDELNAFLGDAKAALNAQSDTTEIINEIQKDLSLLMGILAGMSIPAEGINEGRLTGLIDELESTLPPFTAFAVPGVNPASAKLHIARTICRRAERRLVGSGLSEKIMAIVVPYINRLSDLLFLLARKES